MTAKSMGWAAAAVLAFAVYAPTFFHDTIIDDQPLLHADLSLRQLMFDAGPPDEVPYYRPITISTYLALQAFGQGDVQVHAAHVSSVLLHVLASASVFGLAFLLLRGTRYAAPGAAAGAVLFAVHPIHTESVAWITARPDIIVGLFLFAALASYLRYRETRSAIWLASTGIAALGAPLSKEVGVAVFVLLPAFEWLYVSRLDLAPPLREETAPARRGRSRKTTRSQRGEAPSFDPRLAAAAVVSMAGLVYVLLRLVVFGGLGSSGLETEFLRPREALGALGFYVEKLIVPRDLVAFYAEVPVDATSVAWGIAAVAAFAVALALALRTRQSVPAFGLIWIAVTLAPSMPMFVAGPSNAPIAERYLYLPSIGLALCAAWLFATGVAWVGARMAEPAAGRGLPLAIVAAPVLIVAGLFAYGTVTRLDAYADLETFWSTTVHDNPSAGFPRAGLASEYARQGRFDDAKEQFLIAVEDGVFEDEERRGLAWDSLGAVYVRERNYTAAVDAYEHGIALFPTSPLIHSNLAITHYNEATKSDPPDGPLLAAALEEARIAVAHEADQVNLMLLATIARESGDLDAASAAYREVLRIDSTTTEASRARRELVRIEAGQ